jgi:hypothetical protein
MSTEADDRLRTQVSSRAGVEVLDMALVRRFDSGSAASRALPATFLVVVTHTAVLAYAVRAAAFFGLVGPRIGAELTRFSRDELRAVVDRRKTAYMFRVESRRDGRDLAFEIGPISEQTDIDAAERLVQELSAAGMY